MLLKSGNKGRNWNDKKRTQQNKTKQKNAQKNRNGLEENGIGLTSLGKRKMAYGNYLSAVREEKLNIEEEA